MTRPRATLFAIVVLMTTLGTASCSDDKPATPPAPSVDDNGILTPDASPPPLPPGDDNVPPPPPTGDEVPPAPSDATAPSQP
jgi:hypothetical protein